MHIHENDDIEKIFKSAYGQARNVKKYFEYFNTYSLNSVNVYGKRMLI